MIVKWRVLSHLVSFTLGLSLSLLFIVIPYNGQYELHGTGEEILQRTSVVLVLSGVTGTLKRNGIRQSWGSALNPENEELMFAVGVEGVTPKQRNSLIQEAQTHRDLLLLPVTDTYRNLTFKLLSSLHHISLRYNFTFLIKIDDDSFVNVVALREYLRGVPAAKLYLGYFNGRATIQTKGKWREENWFLCDKYLPYALGGGYVLTSDLVRFLSDNIRDLSMYVSEDVSVGAWLAGLKLNRIHEIRFDAAWRSRGCLNGLLILHKRTSSELISFQNRLNNGLTLCEKEYISSPSYRYNWSMPPSKCCTVLVN